MLAGGDGVWNKTGRLSTSEGSDTNTQADRIEKTFVDT